jgi:hypothetical protein
MGKTTEIDCDMLLFSKMVGGVSKKNQKAARRIYNNRSAYNALSGNKLRLKAIEEENQYVTLDDPVHKKLFKAECKLSEMCGSNQTFNPNAKFWKTGGRLVTQLQWDIFYRRMNGEMYNSLYERSVDEIVGFVIELAKSSTEA